MRLVVRVVIAAMTKAKIMPELVHQQCGLSTVAAGATIGDDEVA